MKYLDGVRLIRDDEYYNKYGVFKGRLGTIISAEIRDNTFEVTFEDERFYDKNFVWTDENMPTVKDDVILEVEISDLELVKDNHASDEDILAGIPLQNKEWWCKVEDGYIINLLGEKKNKIPYDYNS